MKEEKDLVEIARETVNKDLPRELTAYTTFETINTANYICVYISKERGLFTTRWSVWCVVGKEHSSGRKHHSADKIFKNYIDAVAYFEKLVDKYKLRRLG